MAQSLDPLALASRVLKLQGYTPHLAVSFLFPSHLAVSFSHALVSDDKPRASALHMPDQVLPCQANT